VTADPSVHNPSSAASAAHAHAAVIDDQFTRQAGRFAQAPELHNDAVLSLLVEAAAPEAGDEFLDVACGPGSVVAAFAPAVRRAIGLDATEAMLDEARALAKAKGLRNVEWRRGDVYALPFGDGAFDIVTCRFVFHHLEHPARAFVEMVRVCRSGGRIVLCDAVASDDPAKAAAFNAMEKRRDPSTVAMRPLDFLRALFAEAGLPAPTARHFQIRYEREALIAKSFPAADDRAGLRRMIDESVAEDRMGMGARRDGDRVEIGYPSVILVALKP
jgi:ubiquinone/menaquinone biosynthesis C-methylase UbiE